MRLIFKKSIIEKLEIMDNRNWSKNLLNLHYYFQMKREKVKTKIGLKILE